MNCRYASACSTNMLFIRFGNRRFDPQHIACRLLRKPQYLLGWTEVHLIRQLRREGHVGQILHDFRAASQPDAALKPLEGRQVPAAGLAILASPGRARLCRCLTAGLCCGGCAVVEVVLAALLHGPFQHAVHAVQVAQVLYVMLLRERPALKGRQRGGVLGRRDLQAPLRLPSTNGRGHDAEIKMSPFNNTTNTNNQSPAAALYAAQAARRRAQSCCRWRCPVSLLHRVPGFRDPLVRQRPSLSPAPPLQHLIAWPTDGHISMLKLLQHCLTLTKSTLPLAAWSGFTNDAFRLPSANCTARCTACAAQAHELVQTDQG